MIRPVTGRIDFRVMAKEDTKGRIVFPETHEVKNCDLCKKERRSGRAPSSEKGVVRERKGALAR